MRTGPRFNYKGLKFRLHFNRINMQRGNPNIWTVHTYRACYQVREVKAYVPLQTVFNPKGPQPRAYLTGNADIYIRKGVAYLLNTKWVDKMSDDEYFEAIKGRH